MSISAGPGTPSPERSVPGLARERQTEQREQRGCGEIVAHERYSVRARQAGGDVRTATDINIGLGLWRAVRYEDGSGKAWLSERFAEPCDGELVYEPQREARAEYEKHGAKGFKWGPE